MEHLSFQLCLGTFFLTVAVNYYLSESSCFYFPKLTKTSTLPLEMVAGSREMVMPILQMGKLRPSGIQIADVRSHRG